MSFHVVCQVSDLESDIPFPVDIDDELTVAIVRHGDKFFAIEDECSHGNVALSDGDVVDGTIECYLHGSTFDLNTGKALNLPATEPVRVFPCRVDGDDVLVDVTSTTTDFQ